ncbi:hypothetical protein MESS2_730165 [Mesorhizobium metallidurans STM 2683]|uniref:Uncharacterized protein n=1 Tax=Mesorhizobium metallidurans STM 2683 TaxID=1297569 RepID=M5ETH1_9HYPH|nr:hypothetical protein MESS2_730165 [Mesorhizobium metallidurans STM 2683]
MTAIWTPRHGADGSGELEASGKIGCDRRAKVLRPRLTDRLRAFLATLYSQQRARWPG